MLKSHAERLFPVDGSNMLQVDLENFEGSMEYIKTCLYCLNRARSQFCESNVKQKYIMTIKDLLSEADSELCRIENVVKRIRLPIVHWLSLQKARYIITPFSSCTILT